MFGVNYVIPNFAQLMLGYTALQAGMLQIPSSLITSAMFPIVGAMAGKVDARLMVGIGIAFLALSNMVLLPITLNWGWDQFLTTSLFRGFGVVLVFLPLTLAAVGDCDTEDIQTASSLLSLVRTLGGSVGIALLATLLTRREDFHRAVLVEHVTPFNTLATERLQNFIGMFQSKGFSIPDARERALHLLSQQVDTQAIVLAFSDIAWILMTFTALTLPFCFLLTSGKRGGKVEMH